jgi:formate C-acetyltransferase
VSQVLSEMGRQNFKSSTSQSQTKAGFVPNEVFGEGGCEPFDLDYGMMDTNSPELQEPSPFARTNRILKRVHSIPETVSDERALLYTEAHKMYGGTGGSQTGCTPPA